MKPWGKLIFAVCGALYFWNAFSAAHKYSSYPLPAQWPQNQQSGVRLFTPASYIRLFYTLKRERLFYFDHHTLQTVGRWNTETQSSLKVRDKDLRFSGRKSGENVVF
jgi:hypothetical protein